MQDAWDYIETTLPSARLDAQDVAEAAARNQYQDEAWAAVEPGLTSARLQAQNDAVNAAKTNTEAPVAYFEGVPDVIEAGGSFTAYLWVSGIDNAAGSDASAFDLKLFTPEGLNVVGGKSGDLFGVTESVTSGPLGISFEGPQATLGTTGELAFIAFENTTQDEIDLSTLEIESLTIGESFPIITLFEEEIRQAAGDEFDANPLNTEEGVRLAAEAEIDTGISTLGLGLTLPNISEIREEAGIAFTNDPENTESGVKLAADIEIDTGVSTLGLGFFIPNISEIRENAGIAFDSDYEHRIRCQNGSWD